MYKVMSDYQASSTVVIPHFHKRPYRNGTYRLGLIVVRTAIESSGGLLFPFILFFFVTFKTLYQSLLFPPFAYIEQEVVFKIFSCAKLSLNEKYRIKSHLSPKRKTFYLLQTFKNVTQILRYILITKFLKVGYL